MHAVAADGHDLAGLDLALVARAHDVQRARLRRDDRCCHPSVPSTSGRQPRGSRAASSVSPIITRTQYAPSTPRSASASLAAGVSAVDMASRCTSTSESIVELKMEPALLELDPELGGVGDVAVVCERDVPAAKTRQRGLRILDRRRSGGAVARVPDGHGAVERAHFIMVEPVRDETERPDAAAWPVVVDDDDARGLLPAMLQRIEPQTREFRGLGMSADADDTAHVR